MSYVCSLKDCHIEIDPRIFMCPTHRFNIPLYLQDLLYQLYTPGQEKNGTASKTWLHYAKQAVEEIAKVEKDNDTIE